MEKYHVNTNVEKGEVPILTSGEVDLRTRRITRSKQNKKKCFISPGGYNKYIFVYT